MTAPRRLPADHRSMRVERWLVDRRDATPPPDPGRVLERVMADLARSPQRSRRRGSGEVTTLDAPSGRAQRPGAVVAVPPATVGIALAMSLAIVLAMAGVLLVMGTVPRLPTSEAVAPGTVAAPVPADDPTASPRTVVRTDILPGVRLEVEEVEPGVLRVVSDGIRDLTWERGAEGRYPRLFTGGTVATGRDDSVWSFTYPAVNPADDCEDRCALMYRLGAGETFQGPMPECHLYGCSLVDDPVIDERGTLWAIWRQRDGDELRAFDGSEWTVRRKLPAKGKLLQIVLDPQAGVWASWQTPKGQPRVGYLAAEGWDVYELESLEPDGLAAHGLRGAVAFGEHGSATRLADGVTWDIDGLDEGSSDIPVTGKDGSHWWLAETAPGLRQLIRTDWLESTAFDVSDEAGARPMLLGVSADGSAWLLPNGGPGCDGLARFDGQSWSRYLPSTCVSSVAFGDDGSVWLQDGAPRQVQTYIIRPAETG